MKNFSGAMGYLLVGLFIYVAVTKGTSNPKVFLNMHGIVIVAGGLIVAAFASFPMSILVDSSKAAFRSMFPKSHVNKETAEQVVQSSIAFEKGMDELDQYSKKVDHSFLSQSLNLILEGLPANTVLEILNKRIEEKKMNIQTQMNTMLTFSKYSPALGLAATVLGLVDLLSQLQDADMAKLGYGMAIALSATFYGIVMSNLVFAPLSEMIASSGEIETKELEMICDGIRSLLERKHSLVVGEVVNSYLPEEKRIDFIGKLDKVSKAA